VLAALSVTTRPHQLLFGLLNGRLQQIVKGRAALISREFGELLCVPAKMSEITCSRSNGAGFVSSAMAVWRLVRELARPDQRVGVFSSAGPLG
jgi:hypothetical protein